MIKVIHGKKGSGKTKRIIDMTNASFDHQHGDVIFIDDDNRYMFDLRHEVRFVNAGEYGMVSPEMFYGFLCGIISQNSDISSIFIDAFLRLVNAQPNETEWFFNHLEQMAEKHDVEFILSVSCDDSEAPDFIKQYFI